MDEKLKLALIYGSTREARFCDIVAGWAIAEIGRRPDLALDVIDPARLDLQLQPHRRDDERLRRLGERLAAADAFVVVTPEYNHGYPAPLKALIDAFNAPWQAKPVAFVSYGGISGGLRAVEQLRLVFAELHAVAIRDSVSFANARRQFGEDGAPRDAEAAGKAMATLLAKLRWWALALRRAREAMPYSAAVA
jgi:NAD(P)H-dependent FMN reductase